MQNRKRRKFLKTSLQITSALALSSATNLFANQQDQTKGIPMQLTNNAQQNIEALFGNPNLSELAKTDPEFMQNYVNFAFDEVYQESAILPLPTRLKLILGSLIATQGINEFKNFAQASLKNGVSPVEIKEIIYQATSYVGMGKSLEFILASNEVFKANKIKLPLESQMTTTRENRQEKGLAIQRHYFGASIDKGNAAAKEDVKHIRRFLSANCFGDYYTRKGLDRNFRELLTFAILISLGGVEPQVKAHIQGNLNIGNDRKILIATTTALIPYIGYPRSLNALNAIDEMTLEKG